MRVNAVNYKKPKRSLVKIQIRVIARCFQYLFLQEKLQGINVGNNERTPFIKRSFRYINHCTVY
jgi:hypothetical protein